MTRKAPAPPIKNPMVKKMTRAVSQRGVSETFSAITPLYSFNCAKSGALCGEIWCPFWCPFGLETHETFAESAIYIGSRGRARTYNHTVNSRVLYH